MPVTILDYLGRHSSGYGFVRSVDSLFVEQLLKDFPSVDILEEIKPTADITTTSPPPAEQITLPLLLQHRPKSYYCQSW